MPVYENFICLEPTPAMQETAIYHARQRTREIVRQFIPRDAPLSHPESNYVGALGELAVYRYFGIDRDLPDNYADHQVDNGDIRIGGLIYDIKTEAIPLRYYRRLFYGAIAAHEPYGCRVWTARHKQHLDKYTGGVIFVAVPIPNDSKKDQKAHELRPRIVAFARQVILIGYVRQNEFKGRETSWYSPPHPLTGKRLKYNSPNYIFHHSEIHSIRELQVVV
jgi:hypothetical protein